MSFSKWFKKKKKEKKVNKGSFNAGLNDLKEALKLMKFESKIK